MRHTITKYNHYNPCFWTAYWNPSYFKKATTFNNTDARKQQVYTLNVHSNTIYKTQVEKVFYQKNLGKAKVTPDSMKLFCKKHDPNNYEDFCKEIDKDPRILYLDFEDILTAIEGIAYKSLLDVIREEKLISLEHKGSLATLIMIHVMRSYPMMTSMLNVTPKFGWEKWEYFVFLKNSWSNFSIMVKAVEPIAFGHWTFYRTKKHMFPLCDSPVMISNNTLMVILSPRVLLEVDFKDFQNANALGSYQTINPSKFREFQQRVISNTFKDIIFHQPKELEEWQKTPEFINRVSIINNKNKREEAIDKAAMRILWAINGFS